MILAADVGGTKIHLALFDEAGRKHRESVVPTAEVASPVRLLADFAGQDRAALRGCGLGVAGPVVGRAVRSPANLPWELEADAVEAALDAPVVLRNDLEASARGLALVSEDETVVLQEGEPREGNRALVSPGTGLGEALLLWNGSGYEPVAGEGGHADFGPRTDDEVELFRWLRERHGRVSWEHVVSGPGLGSVFAWLMESGRFPGGSSLDSAPGGAAAVIAQRARDGEPACRAAVRIWIGALGAEAGNVALRGLALGGVWLGGGMPARMIGELREPEFLAAFRDKAPHEELLRRIPVRVLTTPETTLRGAWRLGAEAAGGQPATGSR